MIDPITLIVTAKATIAGVKQAIALGKDASELFHQFFDAKDAIMKEKGMGEADFQSTLRNETLLKNVMSVHDVAAEKFGVASTPTFFINGVKYLGNQSPDAMRKILDPLVRI